MAENPVLIAGAPCPEKDCPGKLVFEPGVPMTRHYPGDPECLYCPACGCTIDCSQYPVDPETGRPWDDVPPKFRR